MKDSGPVRRDPSGAWGALPWPLRVAALYSVCLLAVAAAVYVLAMALARVAAVTIAVAAALLLTALVEPLAAGARRLRAPRWLAALLAVLAVLLVVALPVTLAWNAAREQFGDLGTTLDRGLDRVSDYLVNGPPRLDQAQLDAIRDGLAGLLPDTATELVTGAATAFEVLTAVLVTAFLVFFLVKDGSTMWAWFIQRLPAGRRDRMDHAGREGWRVLGRYTRGMVAVASVDAIGIGLALVIVDVPLVIPLILLTFLGGMVPYLGATVAGAAAVLVTLVSNDLTDAVIVLVAVVTVQALEGNLLEPLIIGRAVRLHPAAVLVSVAVGGLIAGIGGAVVAVPLLAVGYRMADLLTHSDAGVSTVGATAPHEREGGPLRPI